MATTVRQYPDLADLGLQYRPLSLVCVHFSDDIDHNFRQSRAACDPLNQVIVVDNRSNVFFPNLGSAMRAGLEQARHSLVVFVHEDVLLPDHWQQHFEQSLRELERHDADWAMLGAGGWTGAGAFEGRLSDPGDNRDTLNGAPFREVERIDEQIIVLRIDGRVMPDPVLPSIHNIGEDLALSGRAAGRRTYVVNAPTIHKYADAGGRPIQRKKGSPKILDRTSRAYKAEHACSAEYFSHKWKRLAPGPTRQPETPEQAAILDRPLVMLSRGGGGSRLLALAAQDCGWFLGTDVNPSGDTLELVEAMYMGVIRKFSCRAEWQKAQTPAHLRNAAAALLDRAGWPRQWGFKLPESMYLAAEIAGAFPGARFVHLIRDPLSTCLRRTHMSGRLDNQIGRCVLPAAYDHLRRARSQLLLDPPAMHMAVTTLHQFDLAREALGDRPHLTLRFEDMLTAPDEQTSVLASWLGATEPEGRLRDAVDIRRATEPAQTFPPEIAQQVADCLAPLRSRLGYS